MHIPFVRCFCVNFDAFTYQMSQCLNVKDDISERGMCIMVGSFYLRYFKASDYSGYGFKE